MRKALVAANWKMYGSCEFVREYIEKLQFLVGGRDVEIALFPPFVYLAEVAGLIEGKFALGAQNLSQEVEGAFTGEVSAQMLVDVGCTHVLVGHSERRSLYGETNQLVASKFVAARQAGLKAVLCVGESLEQREAGKTLKVVEEQLQAVIEVAGLTDVAQGVIAYEPVWAIGTGRTASPEQAQDVHKAIREMLGAQGEETRILYGGSVKSDNASALFTQPDIDGGLVGGAALNVEEFAAICESAQAK